MHSWLCIHVYIYINNDLVLFSESILEVVAFHEQVARTGFTPDQTMPQMMCEEFYGCDKYLEQTIKPKQIKAKRKSAGSKAMKNSKNNIEL